MRPQDINFSILNCPNRILKEYAKRLDFQGYTRLIFSYPLFLVTRVDSLLELRPDYVYKRLQGKGVRGGGGINSPSNDATAFSTA